MTTRLALGLPLATLIVAAAGTQDSAAEQMWHVFHELHAGGRNAQCTVCDGQYRTA